MAAVPLHNPTSDLHLEFCDIALLVRPGAGRQRPIGLDKKFGGRWWAVGSMVRPTTYFLLPTAPKGAVAQLGERLICTQEVAGSIPTSSTRSWQLGQPGL